MRLHDLKPAAGSHRDRKRLGRGNASGQGTTAGKGTKGEKARSGGMKAGFRGISSRNQRTAKRRGFTNRFKVEYHPINVGELASIEAGTQVNPDFLRTSGLLKGRDTLAKILGDGDLGVALHLVDVRVSKSAREKIEAAGGTVTLPAGAEAPGETEAVPVAANDAAAPSAAVDVTTPAPAPAATDAPAANSEEETGA